VGQVWRDLGSLQHQQGSTAGELKMLEGLCKCQKCIQNVASKPSSGRAS
jgi:hypothetical protein